MSENVVNTRDSQICLHLANGSTIAETAVVMNLSSRQINRIKAKPECDALIRALRLELQSAACGRLSLRARKAVDTLDQLLDQVDEPQARLGAAKAILDHLVKLSDSIDQAEEIRELKEQLANQGITLQ